MRFGDTSLLTLRTLIWNKNISFEAFKALHMYLHIIPETVEGPEVGQEANAPNAAFSQCFRSFGKPSEISRSTV